MVLSPEFITSKFEELQNSLDARFTGLEEKITNLQNDFTKHKEDIEEKFASLRKDCEENISKQVVKVVNDAIPEAVKEAVAIATEKLRSDIEEMTVNHAILTQEVNVLRQRAIESEDRGRRLNIIISGLKQEGNETPEQIVNNFFRNKLQVPSDIVAGFHFRNVHFLGKPQTSGKPRSIICAFLKQTDKNYIIQRGYLLKGSDISMKCNYSPETREVKDSLMMKRKSLKMSEGKNFRVVDVKYYPTLQMEQSKGKWVKYIPREDDEENDDVFDVNSPVLTQ